MWLIVIVVKYFIFFSTSLSHNRFDCVISFHIAHCGPRAFNRFDSFSFSNFSLSIQTNNKKKLFNLLSIHWSFKASSIVEFTIFFFYYFQILIIHFIFHSTFIDGWSPFAKFNQIRKKKKFTFRMHWHATNVVSLLSVFLFYIYCDNGIFKIGATTSIKKKNKEINKYMTNQPKAVHSWSVTMHPNQQINLNLIFFMCSGIDG